MDGGPKHPTLAALLDYWLHDSDEAATEALDEHLLGCDACGHRLDELAALGEGVHAAWRAGAVAAVASEAFVQRLAAQGAKVRRYRVPRGGSVNCTVAPEDEVLASQLEAPLEGVSRVDALLELSTAPGVQHRLQDIPFDARAGEVLYLPRIAEVRRMPAHTLQVTLLAVDDAGTRELGRYSFHHRPWRGG